MCLLKVGVKTEANRKLIDSFFEIFDARVTDPSQIKVFWQIFLGFLYASIDVIMSLFPIFKVNMNDGSMVKQI